MPRQFLNPAFHDDWKLEDTVFFVDPYTETVHTATVLKKENGFYLVHDETSFGSLFLSCEMIFENATDASKVLAEINRKRTVQYLSEINTVEDLVRFLFSHETCGENPDYQAIEAASAKAKALLGIEVA